jgi:DNA-binding GntR family transcriptional regulator
MIIATVSQSAFHFLKAKIITGELEPGKKLDESKLSERLDISRPPIREAFRKLESEHLVYTIPRRGTFVSEISIDDFIELYQVRGMAECCAVDILEEKNIREIPELESALTDVDELSLLPDATPGQELKLVVKIQDFHVKLVEAAKNARLSSFYETINSNVCRYTYIYTSAPDMVKTWREEHRQIADVIRAADYREAKRSLLDHINAYRKGSFLELMRVEIQKRTGKKEGIASTSKEK